MHKHVLNEKKNVEVELKSVGAQSKLKSTFVNKIADFKERRKELNKNEILRWV